MMLYDKVCELLNGHKLVACNIYGFSPQVRLRSQRKSSSDVRRVSELPRL